MCFLLLLCHKILTGILKGALSIKRRHLMLVKNMVSGVIQFLHFHLPGGPQWKIGMMIIGFCKSGELNDLTCLNHTEYCLIHS